MVASTLPAEAYEVVNWSPLQGLISNITNATQAVVTTTTDHGYATGLYVILNVPSIYGMTLNAVQTKITVLSSNTFQTTVNTSSQLSFSSPSAGVIFTPAQVSPASGRFFNSTPGSPG